MLEKLIEGRHTHDFDLTLLCLNRCFGPKCQTSKTSWAGGKFRRLRMKLVRLVLY